MAIVKVFFRKNANRVIRYIFEHSQVGDYFDSENCPPYAQGACEEFEVVRDQHHYKEGRNQAIHIVQSWNENESKKLTPKEINDMGRKLVEDYFKGHQFVIATHTETGKTHNHIVVNTMHMETGRHVESKMEHRHNLRDMNDKICLERGLTIPNQAANERQTRIPQKVQDMVRAGKQSWVWDIKNKADVARHMATSFDQYSAYMEALGVPTRVENKNISYEYPGRTKPKRGDKLGKVYDKTGLEEQFKKNNDKFKAKPEIRQKLWATYSTLAESPEHTLRNADQHLKSAGIDMQELSKDYSSFTKVSRHEFRTKQTIHSELSRGIIPIEELKKAKRSILNYCNDQKIPLSKNAQGRTVLRDRDYVVIDGEKAINTRNGTHATLVDFVASHHHLTLLQAVAKINNNPDLLAFEQHFGEIKRKYTSFYIPKPDQMPQQQALEHLSRFLESHRIHPKLADPLLKHQRAAVSKNGMIRLFPETDSEGAFEFTQSEDKTWNEKKQGKFKSPFFKRAPKGNRLVVFMEPKSYMAGRGHDLFSGRKSDEGILVLMEPSPEHVDHYLKENPAVKRVDFVTPKGRHPSQVELDFFGIMKKKLEPFQIEVGSMSHEKSLPREVQGLSL